MNNEMPDKITVWRNGRLYCRDENVSTEPIHAKSEILTYVRADKVAPVERIEGLEEALRIFEKGVPDLTDYEIVGVYLADCETYENRCRMVANAARAYLALQGGE